MSALPYRFVMRSWFVVALVASMSATAPASEPILPADTVFRGNAILTLDASTPIAEAVAVRSGRIVFVGSRQGVAAYVGDRTGVIDLGSRMLMPAFQDAHIHPMSGGMRLLRCSVENLASVEAVVAALDACARKPASSTWLIVNGLAESLQHDKAFDHKALDKLVADRPLAITIGPGFSMRVNSRALALAKLDDTTAAKHRKDVERDPVTGEPDGLVSGDATMAIRSLWPQPTSDEYREALRQTTAVANRYGIVSVFDASVDASMLAAYHAADQAGELTVRVVAAQRFDPDAGMAQIVGMRALRDAVRSDHVRADAAKFFLDGEIELHTAALLEPYVDAPNQRGEPIDAALLGQWVAQLDHDGFDIHMHAMGDRAVRAGLDAVEHAIAVNGPRDRRDQIAHDEVVDPKDLPRFAALGVAANMQPAWAWHDPVNADAERRLGPQRARMLVPIRSLIDAGVRVVASSDWPAPSMNPLDAIQIGITHRPLDASAPVWHPEQRATLMQMLKAWCTDSAWVMRLDRDSGSITVGKSADLIVLDRDLRNVDLMELHNVRVLMTMLEGRAIYRHPSFEMPAGPPAPSF